VEQPGGFEPPSRTGAGSFGGEVRFYQAGSAGKTREVTKPAGSASQK